MSMNMAWVDKAEGLIPRLHENTVFPKHVIQVISDDKAFQGWKVEPVYLIDRLPSRSFGPGDSFILDFGDHLVGHVQLSMEPTGSPADAPLRLKLEFGEMPCEIGEDFDTYDGWLSRAWLQDELINVDVLPSVVRLPRRYTFRYLKITVLATSRKYKVAFKEISCNTVTSADADAVQPLPSHVPDDLRVMDQIAIRTLQNCMQSVFEDGPKRDRRLWIGDLRLQALANYQTFHHSDLVKRCLYLFAGMLLPEGEVGACVFEKPSPHVDDTRLYDYSLFFVSCLHDYYEATGDAELLRELWPIVWKQLELGYERVDEEGVVRDADTWWCFIDWHPELNKQTPAQAVLIYCMKRGRILAEGLGKQEESELLAQRLEGLAKAAVEKLFDEEQGFFVSGANQQVSWASQIWMVLAEVMDRSTNVELLDRLLQSDVSIRPVTPYMYHHLVEALFLLGQKDRAIEQMRAYWGDMVRLGADTFWELHNPEEPNASPYGSNLINSYCHAWSCTPTYFIRKYLV